MFVINDFNTSVRKAFDEIDPKWQSYEGLVVCGTHTPTKDEVWNTIQNLHQARLSGIPTLGICFGYQLMAIEYARNVLHQSDATSEEFDDEGEFVVYRLPELHVGLHGGETYWNNYAVREGLQKIMYQSGDPFYKGVQYHPEYQSSKDNPHPLLVEFLQACRK